MATTVVAEPAAHSVACRRRLRSPGIENVVDLKADLDRVPRSPVGL